MQKKFVIIDNDILLNDLIEEQVSIVFEKNFNVKFLKNYKNHEESIKNYDYRL